MMGVIKTVCPECGEEFNVFDYRGRKPSIPQADLRKVLKKWYQYEWSGEQDSLYIDLKKLLDGRGE